MNRWMWPVRPALVAVLLPLALSCQVSLAQQKKIELPSAVPGIGAAADSLRSDLDKLNAYNASVEEKISPVRKNARDPFQTTPELRSRSGRAGFSPASIGGGELDEQPVWRVQAMALGRSPYAVLVRRGEGSGAGRGGNRSSAGTSEPEAMRQRFVRPDDLFEMPDGRLFRVTKIDRQGVWMRSEGVEEEEMRIQ